MTGFGAMVSNALKVKPHIYRFSVCSTLVDKWVMSFQAMKHAMPRMYVNSAHNEHAPMDYHAQTTYAMNQPNLVKTLSPALGWMSRSMFKRIITPRRMHGLLTTNAVLDSLSTVLHTRLNPTCSLLKYAFLVASTISRSQTHQIMDFAVPLDRVGMRLLLKESLSTLEVGLPVAK